MKRYTVFALGVAALPFAAQAGPHDVFGVFLTEDGGSHVTISDCGDGSPCGAVSWIDPATLEPGMRAQDATGKTGEKVLGLLMLQGFDKKKRDWRGGTIYDPQADKTYASRLKRLENGSLQLKGCIGPICQTQVWPEIVTVEATSEMED